MALGALGLAQIAIARRRGPDRRRHARFTADDGDGCMANWRVMLRMTIELLVVLLAEHGGIGLDAVEQSAW